MTDAERVKQLISRLQHAASARSDRLQQIHAIDDTIAYLATRLSAQPADDARAVALATAKMLKAGDALSFAAQTSGGTAGRDGGLVEAIDGWTKARDAYKAICRIVKYEPSAQPAEVEAVEGVGGPFVFSSVCPKFKDGSNEVDHLEIWVHATFKGTDQAALYRNAQAACAKANAALAVRPSGAEMREPGWQPIETYPRDHFPRLTWSLELGQAVAFLDVTWSWWTVPNGDGPMEHPPTHWHPLPAHPLLKPADPRP